MSLPQSSSAGGFGTPSEDHLESVAQPCACHVEVDVAKIGIEGRGRNETFKFFNGRKIRIL